MTIYQPDIDTMLVELTQRIGALSPELNDLLAACRAGQMRPEAEVEVMRQVSTILRDHPELADQIQKMGDETLAPVLAEGGLVVPPVSGRGLPRLDPLYEAHLLERIQFDGDIPELRHGAVPRGILPAVPVSTQASNPVAVGWQLKRAAQEVQAEMAATEQAAALALEDRGPDATMALVQVERTNLPDPAGYSRGALPALREVAPPCGAELLQLPAEERRRLTWQALATTQGRRSMVRAVRDHLVVGLAPHVMLSHARDELTRVDPDRILAYAEWVMDLTGPESTSPAFTFVDTAGKNLTSKLLAKVERGTAVILEVTTIDMVDVRRVGFCARLLQENP